MGKEFTLADGTAVTVYKRRNNRYLRLSITPAGRVRVSIPVWAPYRAGLEFARTRESWIRSQQVAPKPLKQGQAVGKAHHLNFELKDSAAGISSRLAGTVITVRHPATRAPDHPSVQQAARSACVRALRRQAEGLLPQRLDGLAEKHGFTYGEIRIKHLKSRWGSCDAQGRIALNLYLMQLPWELIDYVLLHELTHTKILKHGPDFWRAMAGVLPNTPELKQKLRDHHPILVSG